MARPTSKATARAGSGGARPATKSKDDIRGLARDAARSALARLAELCNSKDERVALAATQELLNRAFGKIVAAAGDEQDAAAKQLVVKIIRFGSEEADPARASVEPKA